MELLHSLTEECRLCGSKTSELVIKLDTRYGSITFQAFLKCIHKIKLDSNQLLSQQICRKCIDKFEDFTKFIEDIQLNQDKLQRRLKQAEEFSSTYLQTLSTFGVPKENFQVNKDDQNDVNSYQNGSLEITSDLGSEDTQIQCPLIDFNENIDNGLQKNENITEISSDIKKLQEIPLNTEFCDQDTSESDNDYFSSSSLFDDREETKSTESSRKSNMRLNRKHHTKKIKECSVVLEILNIEFVPSDDEEISPVKPLLKLSNVYTPSPKRMKLSTPVKNRTESLKNIMTEPWTKQKYLEYFNEVLNLSSKSSRFNLSVSASAMASDGSITEDYSSKFSKWNDIKIKCSYKKCKEEPLDPFGFQNHKKEHKDNVTRMFSCSTSVCMQKKIMFDFTGFIHHVTEKHFKYLRYACLVCSKMFYNLPALYYHYNETHPDFPYHICLEDGIMFENFSALEEHVRNDHINNPFKVPIIKQEKITTKSSIIINTNHDEKVTLSATNKQLSNNLNFIFTSNIDSAQTSCNDSEILNRLNALNQSVNTNRKLNF